MLVLIAVVAFAGDLEAPVERQLAHHPDTIEWGPCPPPLTSGCAMAVLEGDPKAEGLFTLRLRTTEPIVMAPHTHPRNERVTVLSGVLHVGFGEAVDRDASTAFGPGAYYVNAADTAHFVWADGPVEAQITGLGPWVVKPLAPPEE